MTENRGGRRKKRIKNLKKLVENTANSIKSVHDLWIPNLASLERSLEIMKDELFNQVEGKEVSVTGQILISEAADRAAKIVKEAVGARKAIHPSTLKIAKLIERSNQLVLVKDALHIEHDLFSEGAGLRQALAMVHDCLMTDGMDIPAIALKSECYLHVEDIWKRWDPYWLKMIVADLRDGEIFSSLDWLNKTMTVHSESDDILKGNLRNQMITDCIEMDDYGHSLKRIKKFKNPWEELEGNRMIGAIMMGKEAVSDRRYKDMFDFENRDIGMEKMCQFFVNQDSPIKLILQDGQLAMCILSTLNINDAPSNDDSGPNLTELPLEVAMTPAHSSFTCPILRETCNSNNPPMRLICGHVVSRDAISRLTNNLRQMRSSGRYVSSLHSRFKCPYCPREQYMDTARKVEFGYYNEVLDEIEEELYYGHIEEYNFMNGHLA